jgi:hypothetical protein
MPKKASSLRCDLELRKRNFMKDARRNGAPLLQEQDLQRSVARASKKRYAIYCSICKNRIWFHSVQLCEPESVPEPRHRWFFCKRCHSDVLDQIGRSPVRSPFRTRIAVGLVAAERSLLAYSTEIQRAAYDRRWILLMALAFIVAMLLHLVLIVIVAGLH